MQIADAIRTAESEHVVLFLLTAYLESLNVFADTRASIPASVRHLPLVGKSDLESRAALLRTLVHAGSTSSDHAVRNEALDVLVAAWEQLHLMEDPFVKREPSLSRPSEVPAAAVR